MRKVAMITFYTDDGKILLQDRKGISKLGEKWAFFGGGIEEGETPEQAVIRETKEELDYDLNEYKFIGVITFLGKNIQTEKYIFISKFPGFSEFNQKEGSNMQLFSLNEAYNKLGDILGDDKVVEMIKNIL